MVDRIELHALEAAERMDCQMETTVERKLLNVARALLYRDRAVFTTALLILFQMEMALDRKLAKAERTPLYKNRAALTTAFFKKFHAAVPAVLIADQMAIS